MSQLESIKGAAAGILMVAALALQPVGARAHHN
jgi:hypothetical protein